uniref:Signal transducer and activator of transcription n=1 Tax=Myripristis murdjan TaxID=586833 RepID=A0A668AV00_9TELE
MAQWERLRQLHSVYQQQLDELYDRDGLPMDVRYYLAAWIEKQEWERAVRDYDLAMVLFQVLLDNLDTQHSRFVQEEQFLLKHNIRRYKQNFQVCLVGVHDIYHDLQNKNSVIAFIVLFVGFLLLGTQCVEHALTCLEEQQDEFDFKYKTHQMEGNVLVKKELLEWQKRQQKACIGAPDNVCLDQLENWFTCVAVCLFQVREFLSKLQELMGKLTYPNDPVKAQKPVLQSRVDSLLTELLKSAFVVETQPSMPQGKGPLVLRTNVQFSVKTRLLVKFPELNHAMRVTGKALQLSCLMRWIVGKPFYACRYRRFNVLGSNSKALNMAESQTGGMVADFRHLIFNLPAAVCCLRNCVCVCCLLHGTSPKYLLFTNQAASLPVVVISNSSQQQSAWSSILWFNMLSQDPKDITFFANCPAAMWPQLGEMLSWQFLSATKRGLEPEQLDMIAYKLFGKQQNYDSCKMTWSRFSKENVPNANFTFWVWFDGILVLVKTYLENLWRDGSIMGFVSKAREKTLLKKKQTGTFLLRFSESVRDGGITFSWVEYSPTGEPDVKSVQPFTKVDLSQIPFHEIIRNFQIFEAENVPENPLLYLYPNTPKDEAFGKYYTDKTGDDSPYIKYIKTKLMFVSKE